MPKGSEQQKNARKKPKLTLMEKRHRKKDKKARESHITDSPVSEVYE